MEYIYRLNIAIYDIMFLTNIRGLRVAYVCVIAILKYRNFSLQVAEFSTSNDELQILSIII